MQWIEIKVVFDQPGQDPADKELAADLISDIFYDFGLQGVVVEDPGIAPEEDWAEDAVGRAVSHSVTAYLPEDSQLETRCRTMEKKLSHLEAQSGLISRISYKKRDAEDWAHAWKAYFWPQKISRRLVVKPTWREYTPASDDIIIELDPGMAFGTGTHPTTALCAAMVEAYLQKGDSFLDVGTGSGILMIAAARLGAARVCGIDKDETAVQVATANLKLNSIQPHRFEVKAANLIDETSDAYDIIAANILTHVILELIVDIRRVLNPGGIFICSGIIEKKQRLVTRALQKIGFDIIETAVNEEWVAIASSVNNLGEV
ncbi:MAG: 50S ribosomal protein L11 methyltransferase [Deltaproteobacteria bacterium]|nr:50S ribosomal protein L11 methyltransferase [Deltaproteobacteria bacterium]